MNRRPEQAAQEQAGQPEPRGQAAAPGPGHLPEGYQLLRQTGSGRYANVYLCRKETTGAEVAVKVCNVSVPSSGKRLAAHSELLAAGAAARHPCAVTVEDAGFTPDKQPYVAMRFCRGGNAQAKLAASGPFPVEEVLAIGVRMALALHSSHLAGVLHLDVRPANVLYDEQGDSLLADHGVARILQRCVPELGAVFDPMFASREMFGWERPGPAADVYGLGATLYALLAGEPAYSEAGRNGWAALYAEVLKGELPHPGRADLPPDLLAFLQRMMSAQPENRPPLTEVHRALRSMLPVSYSSRVPDLEPEPAPELPLPGWDPKDDITLEEEVEAERISSEAEAAIKRRNRNRILAGVSVLVVFAAAATALVLTHKGDGKGHQAKTSPSPSSTGLTPVPAKDLPELRPQNVQITVEGNNVQVSWSPPKQSDAPSDYLVLALSPQGENLGAKSTARDERQVVFVAPDVPGDSCFVVSTLINSGQSEPKSASAKKVCGKG